MQDVLRQVIGEIRSAWRFRWFGAAVAWIVFLLGLGWVVLQPDIYQASATVYVDTSSVLRPILNNQIVAPDVATQLAYVRQALLGREHLERVARENGIDLAGTGPAALEAALAKLQQAVTITASQVTRDAPNSVYTITYRNFDRDTSVGVVRTLLNSLVEDTLKANRESGDTAERFLDARIREYANRLQQTEQALANFKRENSDRLPGSQGDYFVRIQDERQALEAVQKSLRLAESKRDGLRIQMAGGSAVVPAEAVTDAEPPPNSVDARIRDHRAQLDRLLLEYTDRHPDVIAVRESLMRLEQQRAEQLRSLGVIDSDRELSALDSSPVYQALQIALNDTEVEIATLRADVAERTEKLAELQSLIDEVPEVEAELARLNRDYDVVYEQYQSLIRSRETQDLSRKASDTDQVDFHVINSPLASFQPVAPNRLLLLGVVLVAALGAGGGLCYLFSSLKPVFSDIRALREVSGLPVLGAVGQVMIQQGRLKRRVSLLSFSAAMLGLVLLFAVAVLIELVGPGLHAFATASSV
jgi:polysaccharide chain length determinant protein (PEP-CTERM system associated)